MTNNKKVLEVSDRDLELIHAALCKVKVLSETKAGKFFFQGMTDKRCVMCAYTDHISELLGQIEAVRYNL